MFFPLLVSLLLHPFHETVAEVEWNRETARLEVALRMDLIDEQWLRRAVRQGIPSDDNWEVIYLRSRFRVSEPPEPGQPDTTKYKWIGRDEERGHVWWYFEIEPPDHMRPRWLENRMLFEKEKDQINRVVVLGGEVKQTLVLTARRPRGELDQEKQQEKDEVEQDGAKASTETDR